MAFATDLVKGHALDHFLTSLSAAGRYKSPFGKLFLEGVIFSASFCCFDIPCDDMQFVSYNKTLSKYFLQKQQKCRIHVFLKEWIF
jgi:hypothetical protein